MRLKPAATLLVAALAVCVSTRPFQGRPQRPPLPFPNPSEPSASGFPQPTSSTTTTTSSTTSKTTTTAAPSAPGLPSTSAGTPSYNPSQSAPFTHSYGEPTGFTSYPGQPTPPVVSSAPYSSGFPGSYISAGNSQPTLGSLPASGGHSYAPPIATSFPHLPSHGPHSYGPTSPIPLPSAIPHASSGPVTGGPLSPIQSQPTDGQPLPTSVGSGGSPVQGSNVPAQPSGGGASPTNGNGNGNGSGSGSGGGSGASPTYAPSGYPHGSTGASNPTGATPAPVTPGPSSAVGTTSTSTSTSTGNPGNSPNIITDFDEGQKIGIGVGIGAFACCLIAGCFVCRRQRKKSKMYGSDLSNETLPGAGAGIAGAAIGTAHSTGENTPQMQQWQPPWTGRFREELPDGALPPSPLSQSVLAAGAGTATFAGARGVASQNSSSSNVVDFSKPNLQQQIPQVQRQDTWDTMRSPDEPPTPDLSPVLPSGSGRPF